MSPEPPRNGPIWAQNGQNSNPQTGLPAPRTIQGRRADSGILRGRSRRRTGWSVSGRPEHCPEGCTPTRTAPSVPSAWAKSDGGSSTSIPRWSVSGQTLGTLRRRYRYRLPYPAQSRSQLTPPAGAVPLAGSRARLRASSVLHRARERQRMVWALRSAAWTHAGQLSGKWAATFLCWRRNSRRSAGVKWSSITTPFM